MLTTEDIERIREQWQLDHDRVIADYDFDWHEIAGKLLAEIDRQAKELAALQLINSMRKCVRAEGV